MKINILNEKLNKDPEKIIEVTKQRFFEYFFRLFQLRVDKTLSDNEIKVLSILCANKALEDTGISKSNLPPVIKKLEEKGLMNGKELSDYTKNLRDRFVDNVEIVLNFKIVEDDIG